MSVKAKYENTFYARIYIAGNLGMIEEVCREFVEEGMCVNVTSNNYIYTFGEQSGAIVELINYPLYPSTGMKIFDRAEKLANLIAKGCHQRSWTIVTPETTVTYQREI